MIKKRKIKLSEAWKKVDFTKPSTWMLIFSNIIVIFFAIIDNLNAIEVLWIYWIQSVIIGVFNFIRILSLKEFTTTGLRRGAGGELPPTKVAKISTGIFFLFHYGFFHLVYLIFLLVLIASQKNISILTMLTVLVSIGIFFVNHLFSFLYNREQDSQKIKNIGTIMFFPYARILPMHLTIVFGFFLAQSVTGLIFFMVLKTIADVIMHMVEHKT